MKFAVVLSVFAMVCGCSRSTALTSIRASPDSVTDAASGPGLLHNAETSPRKAELSSEFHLWAEGSDDIVVEGADGNPMIRFGVGLARPAEGQLERDPAWMNGISSPTAETGALIGRFPESAWLLVTSTAGRDRLISSLSHWERGSWREIKSDANVGSMAFWRGGRVLGLSNPYTETAMIVGSQSLKVIAGPPMPGFRGIDGVEDVTAFAALETGEILVVGSTVRGAHPDETFVQRWSAAGVRAKAESLGAMGGTPSIALRSENEAYVYTSDTIAAWDGVKWTRLDDHPADAMTSVDVSKQGTLWVAGVELHRRKKGQGWETLPLPRADGDTAKLVQVRAKDDDDVWLVAESRTGPKKAVFRNRPAASVFPLPASEDIWRESRDLLPVTPATPACKSGGGSVSGFFVSLGALGPDSALPDLSGALKAVRAGGLDGVRFVETRYKGERQVGAEVEDFAQGNELIAILKKQLPGSAPRFVCHVFVVTRSLGPKDGEDDEPSAEEPKPL